ncbi:MAG: DUF3102 domain-containing protein [Clostridia bacterium]|nr:DUF3102 domain-containing protein [Clostridia bacterium]
MSNEVTRTAAHVAADINTIKSHASAVFRAAVDEGKRSCIRIGKLLEEAKCLVHHGEWGAWLKDNVDYSESTAQNLMRCYREFGDEQIDLFSGVSDADFFAVLSQSQMLELLALPKERRREFVEEHREELESGEMSVRDMKVEIAKLRMKNEAQAKDLEQAEWNNERLEKDLHELGEMLDAERSKPAPEPVVQEVIVNQPTPEKIEEIRAAEEQRLREEFEAERSKTLKECREEVSRAEKAKDKAVKEAEKTAQDAGALDAKIKKIEADHKAAVDKLKADHDKKLADMEAAYKKQAKASATGADTNVTRIQISLENFKRDLLAVSGILGKMRAEGGEQAQKADKLQAKVEKILGALISEAGWTV